MTLIEKLELMLEEAKKDSGSGIESIRINHKSTNHFQHFQWLRYYHLLEDEFEFIKKGDS